MQRLQRTVLIIDDEPADRLTYRRYLANDPIYEYTVLEAEHSKQALALCRTNRPDCLLLDYRLPDDDGLALLQRLAAAAHPYLYPVVMLTGVDDVAIAVQAMQRGVHDYLNKNQVTPEQLQRAVSNAMEKVALQQALAQQHEWFRVTLTSIGDAIIATDTTGNVTFLNPVAEALTGWPLAAAQGQPLTQVFQIINEATRQGVENPVAQVLQSGAIVGLANHTLLIARDGRETPIDDSAAPICDAQGNLLGVVLVFRDISERRRAETAIDQLNRQLTERVQERTAEVEESRRQLEHFVNLTTHDLRDTVRGIDHLTTWLNDDAAHLLPTASQRHLAMLRNRVRRLENQLEDLLTYAQAGRREDALRRIDIHALLQAIAQELEAPPTFRFTADLPLPALVTQQAALETVLRHLLDNAIKHHHQPAQGQLYITTKQSEEWIEFILTDDGPGIAPHHHGLIFEMFRTLQPRDQAKGNGVGLAIVKKIVESWGGAITVESAPGQGATFRFTWPRTTPP